VDFTPPYEVTIVLPVEHVFGETLAVANFKVSGGCGRPRKAVGSHGIFFKKDDKYQPMYYRETPKEFDRYISRIKACSRASSEKPKYCR